MSAIAKASGMWLEADIVIIGAGTAGLAAAVAAREKGASKIVLLESRKIPGGNGVFPLGMFAAESVIQKAQAVEAPLDSVYRKAMEYNQWRTNPSVMRSLISKSGDTISWLMGKGVNFEKVIHHFPNQTPEVYHIVKAPGRTGSEVIRALRRECKEESVTILTRTAGKKLLTDRSGKITGVIAATDGKEIEIKTKSVIICTGGFAGNSELIKKYIPAYNENEVLHLMGVRYPGDGMRMAYEAGAVPDDNIVLEMGSPKIAAPPTISPLISKPIVMWINKKGRRFTDESISALFSESANMVWQQPEKTCWILLDENVKEKIFNIGPDPLEKITMGDTEWPACLDKDLPALVKEGKAKISDTLDELAGWIGAEPEVLNNTVKEYNGYCGKGCDQAFAKDRRHLVPLNKPPYCAIKCGVDLLTTHGGIKVTGDMEVINKNYDPIPGLFAAGVDIGDTDAGSYNLSLSGHAFGFSINSGRIAGESAAAFIKSSKRSK